MIDQRLVGLSPEFLNIIAQAGERFARYGQARGGRAFHLQATTLRGVLTACPGAGVPAHGFFAPGKSYTVIVRHANGAQDDDAAPDNRGATLRILDPNKPAKLDAPLLDLLLTTGKCFLQSNAASFLRWISAKPAERNAWVAGEPHIGEAAWDMLRHADSFTSLYYQSKVASHFVAADGSRSFARFRLIPGDRAAEQGFITRSDQLLPPDLIPRAAGDTRSKSFLHDDLRQRITGGIAYLLQIQLRTASTEDEAEAALDCTRPWAEADYPWLDLAQLDCEAIVDNAEVDGLAFNPRHAPADLGLVLASDPGSTGSLNHLRSLVYDMAAAARTGAAPSPKTGRRVCVIGAGVSGLVAARTLEKLGHEVTVLEQASTVGGKCGSVELKGHWYDLGGHFCSNNYRYLGRLVDELNIPIEPTIPGQPYDLERNAAYTNVDPKGLGAHWMRFIQTRDRDFPDLAKPGFAPVATALAEPVMPWLARNDLAGFSKLLEIVYTSSGYGYFSDPDLAALYFLKSAETVVGALPGSSALPPAWTIEGGFQRLWREVAAGLRDLRLDSRIISVERKPDGVRIITAHGIVEADALIVATPLHDVPPYLDATAEERDIFGRVRHEDYYTIATSAQNLPEEGFYLLTPNCTDAALVGRPLAFHHRYKGEDIYLWYATAGPGEDKESLIAKLRADAARMGGEITAVHDSWKWAYFPHFSAADVAGGIHGRLEAMQGRNRTFFVGSLLNFELVECNVAYATELMTQHFGAVATPAPAIAAPSNLLARMQYLLQQELDLPTPPAPDAAFIDMGIDSLHAMSLLRSFSAEIGRPLTPTIFFECPTIAALADHLGPVPATVATGRLAPRIQQILQTELDLASPPPLDTAFMDLGIDSLRAMSLLQSFSAEIGEPLTPTIFFEYPTIADLAAMLDGRTGGKIETPAPAVVEPPRDRQPLHAIAENLAEAARLLAQELARGHQSGPQPVAASAPAPWFAPARRAPRLRLFCFHHAGGSSAAFANWANLFPADIELRLLQLPGRAPRQKEAPPSGMLAMLEAVEAEVATFDDLPFAFFGHSMGAVIAFEIARRLRRAGRPMPFHLFLSGIVLPEEEGPVPDPISHFPQQAEGFLSPLTRADLELFRGLNHVIEDPLDTAITALGGRDDDHVSGPELDSWALETRASFERVMFDGGHDYIETAQAELLAEIQRILAGDVPAFSDA